MGHDLHTHPLANIVSALGDDRDAKHRPCATWGAGLPTNYQFTNVHRGKDCDGSIVVAGRRACEGRYRRACQIPS